ncbi:MAG: phosphoenolpyruvate synthase [Candidatus Pacearchaeota archaeon]
MQQKEEKSEFVKWFSELNKSSGKIAGGKGANLAEIYNLKVPVPPGFVVTAQAYDYFIKKAKIQEKITELLSTIDYEDTSQLDETTEKIRKLILESEFPKEIQEEILEAYESLDTESFDFEKGSALDILNKTSEPMFVAVRSSATAEDLADASFAGQQESFVNVKGNASLISNIKKCFASLFTSRATYYRNKKGFKHENVSLAVVVQKMVDSDKSGVIFSKDPSFKNNNVIIEAVWGLGEGIVSGTITPDKYIVSRDLEILDKKISDKKIAITRDSSGGKTKVKLSDERSKHQVLKDYEIKRLAEISLNLEEHYQKPQDIEFAIEGEEIFIVQTRPITTLEKRTSGNEKIVQGEIILSGIAASPGIASGKIKIINSMHDLSKIKQGDILVTEMTNPDMVVTMQKSAAIVTDKGGMTSHAAIVSREMGIPAVVGTEEATTKLKEGEIITVDGFNGKIYKGKTSETIQKEILPVEAKTKTEIKVIVDLPTFAKRASQSGIKKVGLTRIEGIIAESGKHPQFFLKNKKIDEYEEIIFQGLKGIAKYFSELWIRTSDIRSDEFSNLEGSPKEKEGNPMLGDHGIRYSLKNPEIFKAELKALKRISEQGKKIGVLLPQVISVDEVQKTKEKLKEINFSQAKIGVMIETPAAVQIIKELCDEGIDFISFGTNDLTQYILAIDRNNEEVQNLYNEMHPAVLYQLSYVIRVCKRKNVETSICGQAGSRKNMVKFLVENGIDSISVNADVAKEISDYVFELEKELGESPRQYTKEIPDNSETKDNFTNEDSEIEDKEDLESPTFLVDEDKENKQSDEEYLQGEEAVEATEQEKEDYLKEYPEENSELSNKVNDEKFDEEPEFKTKGDLEKSDKNVEEVLDIF